MTGRIDFEGIFQPRGPTLTRSGPSAFNLTSGSPESIRPVALAWAGGQIQSILSWQSTGPHLVSFGRGQHEVLRAFENPSPFSNGPFHESEGYRMFGSDIHGPLMGFVEFSGGLTRLPVMIDDWGDVYRCGDRYVNVTSTAELSLAREEPFTDFAAFGAEPWSFSQTLGCSEKMLARFKSNEAIPLQLVSLDTGAVTAVPAVSPGRAPALSVVGEHLALFRLSEEAVEMHLVDTDGVHSLVLLPLPPGSAPAAHTPAGWQARPLLVPHFIDEDLSHVAVIWAAGNGQITLSSWQLGSTSE